MGNAQNNDMEAQLESIFSNGTSNPGDTFLYIGIAVAVVGLILLIVGLTKNKKKWRNTEKNIALAQIAKHNKKE